MQDSLPACTPGDCDYRRCRDSSIKRAKSNESQVRQLSRAPEHHERSGGIGAIADTDGYFRQSAAIFQNGRDRVVYAAPNYAFRHEMA
ncbi:hypothetical protein KIN20_022296 [Parelaphostrongylus tenuis]|uniref:Uncharacterized protein n=1 Tax=Parelaphostrongylus tenuis TaxID=148309 RepID=A0AAD5N8U2_PARTN|nr:hypothetical protein KIN20_022296 [Parelaphostrongylus tenuis]